MKKTTFLVFLLGFAATAFAQKAKYVFYFISDGTGVNIVQAAEHYRADIETGASAGVNGAADYAPKPFLFSQFPVVGMATTYSASSRVTDSAASGTALASGHKTTNHFVGMLPDKCTPVYSIAKTAKSLGMAVGIGTSVSIDHATPAGFYAHNVDRNEYHSIGHDLVNTDYVDFFGGSSLKQPTSDKHPGEASLYELAEKAGITVAYGMDEYKAKAKKAKRMLLVQDREKIGSSSLPYALDRKPGEMSIEDILTAQIDFLQRKDNGKGFFLMNEIGGLVDWADHSNDAGGAFAELEAVNRCVEIAYEFYKQHPDETLIVLTSDHDTGGPSLGTGKYEMRLKSLQTQKITKDHYTDYLADLRKKTENKVTWEQIEQSLRDLWGFWSVHKLTDKQTKYLKDVYAETFDASAKSGTEADGSSSLYKKNERLSSAACRVLGEIAMIGYAHGAHTGGFVPVYAIGVGADEFKGLNDNAEIPKKILRELIIDN